MEEIIKFKKHPVSKRPIALLTLKRNIEVNNEKMPRLTNGLVYSAKNLPPQNQKDIVVKLYFGSHKNDGMKIEVEPSYSFNGPFSQYIGEARYDFWNKKYNDDRQNEVNRNIERALTSIHTLATQKDLNSLKRMVKKAFAEYFQNHVKP